MRVGLLVLALILGSCAGCAGGVFRAFAYRTPSEFNTKSLPYPHFVPKYAGGASLRFAMVHDVIHERYPVRGPAYYRERDRLARERLKALPPDSQEAFDLTDDLGVGLDKLGRAGEAVLPLRDKLARQLKAGQGGRQLYTTYANLGTFLIHANMKAAMGGDAKAKANVKEGLEFIGKSINVNPEAHFGREEWQQKIGEYLLAAIDDPTLLGKYDCIGNSFARHFHSSRNSLVERPDFFMVHVSSWESHFDERGELKDSKHRGEIRDAVRKVGAEEGWPPNLAPAQPIPFDEPVLGIVGMWRQGGGANPYFAVALGEIMLRVGQRYIAWTAYERAYHLADKYGWKPEHATFLREQCRQRQATIERDLPADEVAKLRPQFEAELEYGRRFQREYHDYEAAKIAAGADIHDEHFFDEFYKGRDPIATPVGESEWFGGTGEDGAPGLQGLSVASTAVLSAGIAMFAVVLIGRLVLRKRERNFPRSKLAANEVPPTGSSPSLQFPAPAITVPRNDEPDGRAENAP